jgi:predicted ATPase
MSVISLGFSDDRIGWSVAEFSLDRFNLLVGRSGAGKTRILSALNALADAAMGRPTGLFQCRWKISLRTPEGDYVWEAQTDQRPAGAVDGIDILWGDDEDGDEAPALRRAAQQPTFTHEVVSRSGAALIERGPEGIKVEGRDALALKASESVISLLREDERVRPLFSAFRRFLPSRATTRSLVQIFEPRRFEKELARCASLEALRADTRLPMAMKAWIMQEKFPSDFARMVQDYRDIFPSVTELRVARQEELLSQEERVEASFVGFQHVDLAIKEEGVGRMIAFGAMSSGMRRSLMHLLELSLAPEDSVVLVDEYENSLGVNCLPHLTEHLLRRAQALQFILTSHHPYVIENIDRKYWKVVTRRAGGVLVRGAASFPELSTSTRQSAFVQLLDVLDRAAEAVA